jgi:DNA-binding transcriptional MocR family regulator
VARKLWYWTGVTRCQNADIGLIVTAVSTTEIRELLSEDWRRDRPLYRGLAQALRAAVASGEISAGTRLPAERDLAAAVAVSRSTIVSAYDLLRADGWLISRTGSGTFVVDRSGSAPALRMRDMVDIEPSAGGARISPTSEIINLSISRPEPLDELLREAIRYSADAVPRIADHVEYATQGLPELRGVIAESFTARGLTTSARQILVTTGAQQALGLISQLFVSPGDTVILESPTYLGAIDTLRERRARLVAVPASDAAVDVDHFITVARRRPPALMFVMPTCHTITGSILGAAERERLALLSLEMQVPLIEDDIFSGLTFEPETAPPAAAYAEDAPIFTVGSTSKLYWNGLRLGWLRAPEAMVTRLARLKGTVDLGTSLITQLVALRLLQHRESVMRQRRKEMRDRWATAQTLLRRTLPDWSWREPRGGRSLWLKLPWGTATEFGQVALRQGLVVIPGPLLSPDGRNNDRIRVMYVQRENVLREGIERLGLAWEALRGLER